MMEITQWTRTNENGGKLKTLKNLEEMKTQCKIMTEALGLVQSKKIEWVLVTFTINSVVSVISLYLYKFSILVYSI